MKNSNCFKMMLSLVVAMVISIGVNGQNYHSKPTAITNLADESKYLTATLSSLEDVDHDAYLRKKEKQRVIKAILKSLKTGDTVEQAVNANLPSGDLSQISIGIKSVPLEDGEKNKFTWIRTEILNLVSY